LTPPAPAGWSLSARLAWRLSALMAGAILLAAAAVAWRTIATLSELDDSALQQQVRVVAASLPAASLPAASLPAASLPAASLPADAGNHERVTVPDSIVAPFRSSDGDNLFLVFGPGRALLATSDPVQAAEADVFLPRPFRQGFFRIPLLAGHPHGMVGFALPERNLWVVVLQGREQTSVLADSLLGSFLGDALWLLLPIGLGTVLVSVLTLRRGLRPLLRASAAAAAVGAARPGVRLPAEGLPREVTPLVDAVNEALTRLEQTIATQRRFMAEAAHGLRTPLAVLTARLDALGDAPEADPLRHDADRMARLVGQLLRMARLDSLPLDVAEPVSLHEVAVEAIADLAPLGLRRGVDLGLAGDDGGPVPGNRAALVLAVTNLIENAIAYAPAGSAVEVELSGRGAITVRDRGPGIAPEHRERMLRPFERGPAAADGGAGLGLAIVSRIAAAHGGSVRIETPPGGGCAFILQLAAPGAEKRAARFVPLPS
jgi:signal transduction histidine kinase